MPKKVWKVEEFDGGINQKSDSRDIEKHQLVEAFNVDVSNKGMIRLPGNSKILYDSINTNNENVIPTLTESWLFSENAGFDTGWGLFQFNHDFGLTDTYEDANNRQRNGLIGESEFLCINDGPNIHIWCDNGEWDTVEGTGDAWILNAVQLGAANEGKIRPVYYKEGNALRVCDSNFSKESTISTFSSFNVDVLNANDGEDGVVSQLNAIEYDFTTTATNQPISNYIQINNEIKAVISKGTPFPWSLTVLRAQFGTKEGTHSSGDAIYIVNVPKKLIGISHSNSDVNALVRDSRLKNARLYSDTTNTEFTTPSAIKYHGWRECIQSLEPPNNYMMPGLRVYDGKVTGLATSGVVDSDTAGAADESDHHQLLNEPNPEYNTERTNLTLTADSNPEKVLFSIHESKSAEDNVVIGTSTADGGTLGGINTIKLVGNVADDDSFVAKGFTVGKYVMVTGSTDTDGLREIVAIIDNETIQVTGEFDDAEGTGFEIRLEDEIINEDLQNKYVFGMSFLYDGGGSEVQESPIRMGHVHTGLIEHDASMARVTGNWRTGDDLDGDTNLPDTGTPNSWMLKDGQLFFDDSAITDAQSRYLIYEGPNYTITENQYYKISIDVRTMGTSAKLIIYPPGTNASDTTGKIGDGDEDGNNVVINNAGTYLFYAKAGSVHDNIFVAEGKHILDATTGGDIHIDSVQVFKATPEEMTAANAISMKSWQGVPKMFSSFNMGMDLDYRWNPEIIGYKIYMKQVDSTSKTLTDEWLLALRVNFREGEFINYTSNSEPSPLHLRYGWSTTGSEFRNTLVATNVRGNEDIGRSYYDSMMNIPLHTYESENGYKADVTTCAMYKASTQISRKMYIGNLLIDGMRYPDRMLESPVDRPDTFPNDGLHFIDVATADGDEIIHLESIGKKLIQFKKNTTYLIEILDEGVELADTWANAGILSPSQVVKAGDGLVWVNNYGLFYYDGDKLERATQESFDLESWIINENSENATTLGYDAYSRKVIIMTSNLSTHDSGGYIYDLTTNSITEHQNLFDWYSAEAGFQLPFDIPPDDYNQNHYQDSNPTPPRSVDDDSYYPVLSDDLYRSNMVTTNNRSLIMMTNTSMYPAHGQLTKWYDNPHPLWNFAKSAEHFKIKTKDIDFDNISVRKKVHKIYVSFKAGGYMSGVIVKYATNGSTTFSGTFADTTYYSNTKGFDSYNAGSSTSDWITVALKPSSSINNVYSIQLEFSFANAGRLGKVASTIDENTFKSDSASSSDADYYNGMPLYFFTDSSNPIIFTVTDYTVPNNYITVSPDFTDESTIVDKYFDVGFIPKEFAINDISIVYREKPVK